MIATHTIAESVRSGVRPAMLGAGSGAQPSTLLNGLVSWWLLDEVSGTRNDAHGTNHLTDYNTVGSAVGKVGNAAVFVRANSEYLAASAPIVDWTQPLSFTAWFRNQNGSGNSSIFTVSHGNGGQGLWVGNYGAYSNVYFEVNDGARQQVLVGAAPVDEFVFAAATYDPAVGISLSVNDGAPVTKATGEHTSINSVFRVGIGSDIDCDNITYHQRVLSSAEITELYSGMGYPG